jgi:hypothetical protein
MEDLFIFRDHEGIIRGCISIHDRPSDFEKLIGFGLDPFVYRLRWITSDIAQIYEFWWNTQIGMLVRSGNKLPTTPYRSNKSLPKGCVASSTPYFMNSMI